MPIERVERLSLPSFVSAYLGLNRPVIVTDAMQSWSALREWTPEELRRRFGEEKTQVYDDLFFLVSHRALKVYVDRYITGAGDGPLEPGKKVPYVRWYSQQNERTTMPWSDDVLRRLANDWSRPYFMPDEGLLLPFSATQPRLDPVHDRFPARGIFFSARGARTRLHIDPWVSDALLCQVYGEKRVLLFEPKDAPALMRDGKLIDIAYDPATDRWADANVAPWADETLRPGEIILFPAGWPHAAYSRTASISITWNFLHQVNLPRLLEYVRAGVPAGEAESFAYFLGRSAATSTAAAAA